MQPRIGGSSDERADETPSQLECCQPQVPVLAELLCSEPPDEALLGDGSVHGSSSQQHKPGDGHDDGNNEQPDEGTAYVTSYFDPVILHHPDVLSRMKTLESRMEKPRDYLRNSVNDDILPYMRKIVASWMLEVCEEQRCSEIVFPLAVALLDKFLGTCSVKKDQLQLLACVCLLLSSKSRQCNYFSLDLLSWYTDNSVTAQALRSWELMVLSHLNWDINVLTPTDFVDFLLARVPGLEHQIANENQLLRRHAITFMALCSTEPRFVGLKPSLIASSAIYTALNGLRLNNSKEIGASLASMAEVSLEQLVSISASIDHVISTEIAAIEQQTACDSPVVKQSPPFPGSSCSSPSTITTASSASSACGSASSSSKLSCGGQSAYGQNTPTDVQDIVV